MSGLQTDASPLFVSSVVKLVAMQMQALGVRWLKFESDEKKIIFSLV